MSLLSFLRQSPTEYRLEHVALSLRATMALSYPF
jgi:hypothetical protein